jgi:peptidoglycan/LPS O-acetylase OafA/YrhL
VPILKRLGDASYALYLVHLPATALVAHTLGWERPWLFLPAALAASIAAAFACHAWIEAPLIARLRTWGERRAAHSAAPGGSAWVGTE